MKTVLSKTVVMSALAALALAAPAHAQWSLGAPGPNTAPAGENRYIYLVRTNPMAGYEQAFNEVYQNQHLGDLVQFPGWMGAQRFRLVTDIQPRATGIGNRYGYLVLWDQMAAQPPGGPVGAAIAGGKSRRIPGFDYGTPGASWSATYRVLGPKVRAPGKTPFMPALSDNKTPRPNRYILLEFDNVPAGIKAADYTAALDKRISQVLTLPGWMAAQRAQLVPTPPPAGRAPTPADEYLTVWEIEGSAETAQAAVAAATKAGQVDVLARDAATAESSAWLPISPYISKEDFER